MIKNQFLSNFFKIVKDLGIEGLILVKLAVFKYFQDHPDLDLAGDGDPAIFMGGGLGFLAEKRLDCLS